MDSISINALTLLAGKWQNDADTGNGTTERRETLRECADSLRMLCEVRYEDCPHAAPFRYCPQCVVSPCPVGLDQKKVQPMTPTAETPRSPEAVADILAEIRTKVKAMPTSMFSGTDLLGWTDRIALAREAPKAVAWRYLWSTGWPSTWHDLVRDGPPQEAIRVEYAYASPATAGVDENKIISGVQFVIGHMRRSRTEEVHGFADALEAALAEGTK